MSETTNRRGCTSTLALFFALCGAVFFLTALFLVSDDLRVDAFQPRSTLNATEYIQTLETAVAGQYANNSMLRATIAAPSPIPAATPTAFVAQSNYTLGFLADCALGQSKGQRVSPRCPANAAEMLGPGR